MKYRRGQHIILKNKEEQETTIKIIMYDSIQGWLGEDQDSEEWNWYALDTYTFVKQLKIQKT